MRTRLLVLIVLTAFVVPFAAVAQDSHYWTNSYGTRADLLGGTVVGGITDLSSTFYNPGAIALSREAKLVLSTSAFQYARIRMENGAGAGLDLSTSQSGSAPSIFAARITGDWLGESSLAISFLTRYDYNMDINTRRISSNDVFPTVPGNEAFAGELLITEQLGENWFGVTWARPIGDNSGIGVTLFGAYRSQKRRNQIIAQAVSTTGPEAGAVIYYEEYRYWHTRLLAKVGYACEISKLKLGATLTTPSLGALSSAQRYVNASQIDSDSLIASQGSSLAAYADDELEADYQSPGSIAIGASYPLGPTTISVSAEWFAKVPSFVAIDSPDVTPQTGGEPIATRVVHELTEVVNWGLGIEHRFRPTLQFYGAYILDQSAFVSYRESQLSTTSWDIRQVSLGAVFQALDIEFTLGAAVAFGNADADQLVNFTDPDGDLESDLAPQEVTYRRVKVVFGLTFPFKKDI